MDVSARLLLPRHSFSENSEEENVQALPDLILPHPPKMVISPYHMQHRELNGREIAPANPCRDSVSAPLVVMSEAPTNRIAAAAQKGLGRLEPTHPKAMAIKKQPFFSSDC
jgi:hypothetical protein